ncbi:protein C12orf49-like protein [Plecturocebus cupreus]
MAAAKSTSLVQSNTAAIAAGPTAAATSASLAQSNTAAMAVDPAAATTAVSLEQSNTAMMPAGLIAAASSIGCCSAFKYWTSCYLDPTSALLECFPNWAAVAFQNLFMAVEHFVLCLAKCRTSSQSMQHEDTYQDPIAKSCMEKAHPIPSLHEEEELREDN